MNRLIYLSVFLLIGAMIAGQSSAADVTMDFDTFPDGSQCVSGTLITTQYDVLGVSLFSGLSDFDVPGLYCLEGPNPNTSTRDMIPTTAPNFGGLLDDPMDLTRSSTGWVQSDFFPSATSFCVDLLDVEGSGGLENCGSGDTYVDVTLAESDNLASTMTERLPVDCAGDSSQQEICYTPPAGYVITSLYISFNNGNPDGESIGMDTLEFTRGEGCWLTTGGHVNKMTGNCNGNGNGNEVKYSFGGNVGPPPHGNWNHVDHANALHFHSNAAQIIECFNDGGAGPGNPKAKPNVAIFGGTGRVMDIDGKILYDTCDFEAKIIDRGEPGKNDEYGIVVSCADNGGSLELINVDGSSYFGSISSEKICGGNTQIHPPNPSLSN